MRCEMEKHRIMGVEVDNVTYALWSVYIGYSITMYIGAMVYVNKEMIKEWIRKKWRGREERIYEIVKDGERVYEVREEYKEGEEMLYERDRGRYKVLRWIGGHRRQDNRLREEDMYDMIIERNNRNEEAIVYRQGEITREKKGERTKIEASHIMPRLRLSWKEGNVRKEKKYEIDLWFPRNYMLIGNELLDYGHVWWYMKERWGEDIDEILNTREESKYEIEILTLGEEGNAVLEEDEWIRIEENYYVRCRRREEDEEEDEEEDLPPLNDVTEEVTKTKEEEVVVGAYECLEKEEEEEGQEVVREVVGEVEREKQVGRCNMM